MAGGEDWIRGEEGGRSSISSASSGAKQSDAGIVASEDNSWMGGSRVSGMVYVGIWGGGGNTCGAGTNVLNEVLKASGSLGAASLVRIEVFSHMPVPFRDTLSLMNCCSIPATIAQ